MALKLLWFFFHLFQKISFRLSGLGIILLFFPHFFPLIFFCEVSDTRWLKFGEVLVTPWRLVPVSRSQGSAASIVALSGLCKTFPRLSLYHTWNKITAKFCHLLNQGYYGSQTLWGENFPKLSVNWRTIASKMLGELDWLSVSAQCCFSVSKSLSNWVLIVWMTSSSSLEMLSSCQLCILMLLFHRFTVQCF